LYAKKHLVSKYSIQKDNKLQKAYAEAWAEVSPVGQCWVLTELDFILSSNNLHDSPFISKIRRS